MMKSTMQKIMKNQQNLENRKKAYSLPIVNKDMKENDENVRKFFESFKKK